MGEVLEMSSTFDTLEEVIRLILCFLFSFFVLVSVLFFRFFVLFLTFFTIFMPLYGMTEAGTFSPLSFSSSDESISSETPRPTTQLSTFLTERLTSSGNSSSLTMPRLSASPQKNMALSLA